MESAKKPKNERQRIEALQALNILDTLPEKDFDQITFLASQICGTPIALISLVDENRQWFKAKTGLDASEAPRDIAFCAHAILGDDVFVVPDSSKDKRFSDNPLATGAPHVQFYAGAPLLSPDGSAIGTLCVIDSKPRVLASKQIESLKVLSDQVTRLLELRSQIVALKKSAENLSFKTKAVETIFEGVVLQDSTGAIVNFNAAAPSVLNLTADQLLGKTSMDPTWKAVKADGSDFPGHEHPAMVCLQTGQVQRNITMGVRNSTSETRWIKINAAPLFHGSEATPSHVVTSFADITAEIEAKNRLEKKSSNLRFILDSIPHLIGLWSVDEVNIDSNAEYANYFNKYPDEIRGRSLRDLLGDELYKKNESYIKRALAGEKVVFERALPHKDGSIRHTVASYIPSFNKNKVVSFLALVVDVTGIRELEKGQFKLEARLAESAKLAALGEMAAGIAHEINNPLTIIKGASATLVRKASENKLEWEQGIKLLKVIDSTADRIAKIIKALRSYFRDAKDDDLEEANLSDIISDTLELCRERFSISNVQIKVNCESILMIRCRPTQVSQVIMNLLNNAFDAVYDLDEKWVEIRSSIKNGTIHLQVTDFGLGIPKPIADKIMNPFFTTKEVGKGTGLGLSISNGILESIGGTLKFVPGASNTTFMITLPELENALKTKAA